MSRLASETFNVSLNNNSSIPIPETTNTLTPLFTLTSVGPSTRIDATPDATPLIVNVCDLGAPAAKFRVSVPVPSAPVGTATDGLDEITFTCAAAVAFNCVGIVTVTGSLTELTARLTLMLTGDTWMSGIADICKLSKV